MADDVIGLAAVGQAAAYFTVVSVQVVVYQQWLDDPDSR